VLGHTFILPHVGGDKGQDVLKLLELSLVAGGDVLDAPPPCQRVRVWSFLLHYDAQQKGLDSSNIHTRVSGGVRIGVM
jgi:hypothetical protein